MSTLAEVVVAPLQHLFVATAALHIFDVAVAVQILAAAAVSARSKSARSPFAERKIAAVAGSPLLALLDTAALHTFPVEMAAAQRRERSLPDVPSNPDQLLRTVATQLL